MEQVQYCKITYFHREFISPGLPTLGNSDIQTLRIAKRPTEDLEVHEGLWTARGVILLIT
jgi:hypothetical protein